MYNPNRTRITHDYSRYARLMGGLTLSATLLAGCTSDSEKPVPSHQVIVEQGQDLDDIGMEECGSSLLGLSTVPRRNMIIEFNNLDNDTLYPGQVLDIPDSFCWDTGSGPKS